MSDGIPPPGDKSANRIPPVKNTDKAKIHEPDTPRIVEAKNDNVSLKSNTENNDLQQIYDRTAKLRPIVHIEKQNIFVVSNKGDHSQFTNSLKATALDNTEKKYDLSVFDDKAYKDLQDMANELKENLTKTSKMLQSVAKAIGNDDKLSEQVELFRKWMEKKDEVTKSKIAKAAEIANIASPIISALGIAASLI